MVTNQGSYRLPQDYTQDQLADARRLAGRNRHSSSSSRRVGGNRGPGYRADRGASSRGSPYPAHLRVPWRGSASSGSAAPRNLNQRRAAGGRGYSVNRGDSERVGRGNLSAGPASRNDAPSIARRRGFTPLDGASGSKGNQSSRKGIINRDGGMVRSEAGPPTITSSGGIAPPFDPIPDLTLPTRPPSSNDLPALEMGDLTPTTSASSAESQERYGMIRSRATTEADVTSLTGQPNNALSRTPSLDLSLSDDTPSAPRLYVPSYLVSENGSIFPPPPSRRVLLDLPPLPRITMEPSDKNEYPHLLDLNGITSNSNLGDISLVDLIISVLMLRCEHMLRHFMHEDSPFYFHLEIPLAKELMAEGITRIPSEITRWWMIRKGCFVTVSGQDWKMTCLHTWLAIHHCVKR